MSTLTLPQSVTPTSNHQQKMTITYDNITKSHPNCLNYQHENNNNKIIGLPTMTSLQNTTTHNEKHIIFEINTKKGTTMIPATAVQNPLSKHQEMPQLKSACSGCNIHTLTKSIEISKRCNCITNKATPKSEQQSQLK